MQDTNLELVVTYTTNATKESSLGTLSNRVDYDYSLVIGTGMQTFVLLAYMCNKPINIIVTK